MKKIKSIASVAMLAAGLGFSGQAANAADISFMSFSYAEEAAKPSVEALLKGFEAQTKLTVEPLGYAWGDMQKNIFLRSRSKTLPSVAQLSERWLPSFANVAGLVDLNEVYGKDKLAAIFAPDALAMGQIGSKQYALPLISGSIGLIANKAVLEKAGVTKTPTTIEEFRNALVAVRDKVPNSVPYTMATKNNGSILLDFMIWTWTFGGELIDEQGKVKIGNGDAGKQALGFMVSLMKDRLAAPEIDRPDARRLVAQGASAFFFDAPQARTHLRSFSGQGPAFDANVLPLSTPVAVAGKEPASIQWGHLLVQFSADGKAKADAPASQFITYLTSDDAQSKFPLEQSALPVTKSARANPKVTGDAFLTAWAKAAGNPRRNEVGIWPNAAELTQIIGEEAQGALLGQKSVDDAIQAMHKRLETSMANVNTQN
ncbi:MAG: ABC transporter substrate-binding protein [Microvirga sp.]